MGARGPLAKEKKSGLKLPPGYAEPPAHLDDAGRAEYLRAAVLLGEHCTHADMAMLAVYANAWSDVTRMEQAARGNEVVQGPQGPVVNPLLKAITLKKREMLQAMSKLGFSPVDRARVPPGEPKAIEDAFAKFIK
jgi:P27 family predicted phage terminase small subunit